MAPRIVLTWEVAVSAPVRKKESTKAKQ